MPSLKFFGGFDTPEFQVEIPTQGSGLGFYGPNGFGDPIMIGKDELLNIFVGNNDLTFTTNRSGTLLGRHFDNNNFSDNGSGIVLVNDGSGSLGLGDILLKNVPNKWATINIRAENPTPIPITIANQVSRFRVYDGVAVGNPPINCIVRAFEIIHPSPSILVTGSGDIRWKEIGGTSTLSLAPNPGSGGNYAGDGGGGNRPDRRHDWYVGLSVAPTGIGLCQFAMMFETFQIFP